MSLRALRVLLCSYLCRPSQEDEFRRGQTPAVPVPPGASASRPRDGRHAAGLRLPTPVGHPGPPPPGRLPGVVAEEPLGQQEAAPPRRQPAGRHRQRHHLPQPGGAAARELRPRQEEPAVRTEPGSRVLSLRTRH